MGEKKIIFHGKEFFFSFDFSKRRKNKIEDNNEKMCSRISDIFPKKSNLRLMAFTETTRQRES